MALLLYLKLCLVRRAGGMQAESEDLGFRVQDLGFRLTCSAEAGLDGGCMAEEEPQDGRGMQTES